VVRTRIAAAHPDDGWRIVWGDDDRARLEEALADLESPLLFGGVERLLVRRAEALDEWSQNAILTLLPSLRTTAAIVLVARAVDVRRRLFATCIRSGAAHAFPWITDARVLRDWVSRLARELGHAVAPAVADELVDRVGNDLGQLANELEKLSVRGGRGARLEVAHVRATVPRVRVRAVQELADRLARRDLAGALGALRSMLADGEPPVRIVAFLAANLRRALHVAELSEAGLDADAIGRRLGMPGWLVARNAGRGTSAQLTRAICLLRDLDLELKRSRPAEAVLEAAVLGIVDPLAGGGASERLHGPR